VDDNLVEKSHEEEDLSSKPSEEITIISQESYVLPSN